MHILAVWKWNSSQFKRQFSFRHTVVRVVFLGTQYKTGMLAVASKPTQGVFLHYPNKFDTIDHVNFIEKFKVDHFLAESTALLYDRLTNRKQFVWQLDNLSQQQIKCGVPQGSVLGPLLFLIFFIDFIQRQV